MKPLNRPASRMSGLSLVELMVALTIGLIILAAVSSLFVSSKQTYTTQDSLARLQENARFAMQFLIKDLRLAGYYGCLYDPGFPAKNADDSYKVNVNDGSIGSSSMKYNVTGDPTFTTNTFLTVEGLENASGTWMPSLEATLPGNIKPGTDAITIRMADLTSRAGVAPGMLNGSSALNVNDTTPFLAGNIVIVSDCASADVMEVTGVTGDALEHATTGNRTLNLMKAYEPPAGVYRLKTVQYYIGTKTVDGKTVPGLYTAEGGGGGTELVEGVEDMQILYGLDTDGDRVPNTYVKASAVGKDTAWYSVMNARIGILVRTIDDKNIDVDNGTYDLDDDGTAELAAPGDRYRRRMFKTVVQLRNAWAF